MVLKMQAGDLFLSDLHNILLMIVKFSKCEVSEEIIGIYAKSEALISLCCENKL